MLTRKCQWFHMVLLVLCFTLPTSSWALGLDDIDVTSALNERFSGTIEILDAQGFQPEEVMISMASREDFERVGVERFFYLTNLKFAVDMSGSTPKVNITSSQPISEPYLNFIVEVLWPRGRLLKEFTVLLDPPTFSQAAAPAVAAPAQAAPQVTQAARPAPAARPSRPATRVDLQPTPSAAPRRDSADGLLTTRDDTLWKIASRTLASNRVSVNQQMLAIQKKNPNAFIRNNINLLKAGYVLDIPTENEALALNARDANSDVAAQTEDWRSGSTREQVADSGGATQLIDDDAGAEQPLRSQVDATVEAKTQTGSAAQTEGQVRIVATTGELASGSASGDDPSVNQLIEDKDSLSRQVDELTYQLDREKDIANNQVTVKDRQLEVKDQEIAAMQQQMKEVREQLAEAAQNQNQSPELKAADSPWWMSPLVLFGVIGALVLVLVATLIALRRKPAEEEEGYFEDEADYAPESSEALETEAYVGAEAEYDDETDAATDAQVEPIIGDLDDLDDLIEAENEYPDSDSEASVTNDADDVNPTGVASDGKSQTGDVIGEAEIYIAYGRYGQAANLLSGVLEAEPERWDVRLKLLEVSVESQDQANFAIHAQYLVDNCDDEEVLMACRELEAQLDNSHVDLGSSVALDEASSDAMESDLSDHASESSDDSFDLDLDELESVAEANEPAVALDDDDEVVADADADSDTDAGIDFELEFDEPEAEVKDARTDDALVPSDELGGDLGIDFDPEKDVDVEAVSPEALDPEETPVSSETPASGADLDLDDLLAELPEGDAEVEEDMSIAYVPSGMLDTEDDTEAEVENVGADSTNQAANGPSPVSDVEAPADDFEFESDGDSDINTTKLDLAEAYVDMGDADGAQDILKEVLEEGTSEQKEKAQQILDSLEA